MAWALVRRTMALALLLALPAAASVRAGEAFPRRSAESGAAAAIEAEREEGGEGTQEAEPEKDAEATSSPWDRFRLYGFIKVDGSWDENTIDPGNFARWVVSPATVEEHSHYNMTVRETRLGLDIAGVDEPKFGISGRVEVDLYGGGAENKEGVQLRHAYAALRWPERGLSMIVGQSWDIISPLVPRTLNYSVAWWTGNIGYRRPLVAVTKELGEERSLLLTGAVSRTIGDDFAQLEPGDSGADSGVPTVQARAAWQWDAGETMGAVGVSGHWGQERLKEELGDLDPDFDSWSVNLDLRVPVGNGSAFELELWQGVNLDDYLGGIGQGINRSRAEEIEATGGWLGFESGLWRQWLFSAGVGMDDPDDEDLAPGSRSRNVTAWLNGIRQFPYSIRAGLEVSYWSTDYLEAEDGESLRVQASFIYDF